MGSQLPRHECRKLGVPLLIIGLFCGCSYSFRGPDLEKDNINKAWDKASAVAESIKEDIKREMDNAENDTNNKKD